MKLITTPTDEDEKLVELVLSHAATPVKLADLLVSHPSHYVSAWRNVVLYILHGQGVSQQRLAEWFGIHVTTVHKGIKAVRRILKAGGREAELIQEIEREARTPAGK